MTATKGSLISFGKDLALGIIILVDRRGFYMVHILLNRVKYVDIRKCKQGQNVCMDMYNLKGWKLVT